MRDPNKHIASRLRDRQFFDKAHTRLINFVYWFTVKGCGWIPMLYCVVVWLFSFHHFGMTMGAADQAWQVVWYDAYAYYMLSGWLLMLVIGEVFFGIIAG